MCRVLGVSPSGYYDWVERQPSVREKRRDELAAEIRTIHAAVKKRYGSPRMHAELVAKGRACSVNTVAKIMKGLGIQAVSHKRFRVSTTDSNHDFPVAPNVVNRDFAAAKADEVWLTDITYVPTREGWLYLAAVEDLYSRRVVGWSMGTAMESRLVVDALEMAVKQRYPDAGLVAHSDRGSQYASEHYRRALAERGITCSMSRKGGLLRQRADGIVLRDLEKGTRPPRGLPDDRRGESESVRVHRSVLQQNQTTLIAGVRRPSGVRICRTSLTARPFFVGKSKLHTLVNPAF